MESAETQQIKVREWNNKKHGAYYENATDN